MNSIQFPIMFNNTTTNVVEGRDATLQNMKLLLLSDRGGLFGDPYYGTILKRLMFEQNDVILRDIVVDSIYTAILLFIPQVKVNRQDILVELSGSKIVATIKAKNMLDFLTDIYNIDLTSGE